ncbi:TonB-dependent receptor [Parahaliea maris]|uniref:TonB-dependent receptor n=1 Tax=Parahaliea maris TaxID=2716870 RepID=A0A5C8ZM11_9GAMM|nr:TonB-dependent receptor [Parahaliea maris]TXS89498.1 TonB-dependent receptor [Parahaliea maris]
MKPILQLSQTRLAFAIGALVTWNTASAAVLEEVVVTAQKREQSLQDVPISLSVVGGNDIENFALRDFSDLSTQIPNFFVQDTPANYAIYIRGMGSTAGNSAFEQTVGLFVDGVYAGRARQFQSPFLDVDRIEVMRGPQGALVGKNTSAGAINVLTRKPTDETEASISAGYEFEGETTNVRGIVSGALSDTLRGRLAVSYIDTAKGFTENLVLGDHEKQVSDGVIRGTLGWDITDQLDATLKLETSRSRIDGNSYETIRPGEKIDYKRSTSGFPTVSERDFNDTDADNLTLTLNYGFNDFTLTSITGFSQYDFSKFLDSDFSAATLFGSSFAEDFDQLSQELRLVSPGGETLEYVVGLYAHTNSLDMDQSTELAFGPFVGTGIRHFEQDNDVLSLYAQATWYITDALRVSASARQTEDKKDADQQREIVGNVLPSWLDTPLSGDRDESHFDPAINLQWDVAEDTMLYATWSEGSKAGGFVGAQASTKPEEFEFDPEEAETFEVGVKTRLFDSRLSLNAAYFYTEYTDLQVSAWDADSSTFVTGNAASATTEGVEADFAWALGESVTIMGSAAYLDATYDEFLGADCLWNNPGCDVPTNDIGGTRLPRSSEWSGNLSFVYDQPIGELFFSSKLDVVYNSEKFLMEDLNPRGAQDDFTKVNLRLALSDADERWTVALVGKNITDETTISHAFGTPLAAPGTITYLVDAPRTVALQLDYRFR